MRIAAVLCAVLLFAGCARKQSAPVAQPAPAPVPQQAPPKPKRPAKPAKPRPAVEPPPAEARATPPLGVMLTPEQRHDLLKQAEASIERAQRNIGVLHARQPSPEQMRGMARVETLIRQAQDARRDNDVIGAKNLGERAEALSQELLRQ